MADTPRTCHWEDIAQPDTFRVDRGTDYGWTDCDLFNVVQSKGAVGTDLLGPLFADSFNFKDDHPNAVSHGEDVMPQFYMAMDEDMSLGHYCMMPEILDKGIQWLQAPDYIGPTGSEEDMARVRHKVYTAYTPEQLGCTSYDACGVDIDIQCVLASELPTNKKRDDGVPEPAAFSELRKHDGCAWGGRYLLQRQVIAKKTRYDEAFKQDCCKGNLNVDPADPNRDVRCDPRWRPDDPAGECLDVFLETCFQQQPEPCGRVLALNDQPSCTPNDDRSYCKTYLSDVRAAIAVETSMPFDAESSAASSTSSASSVEDPFEDRAAAIAAQQLRMRKIAAYEAAMLEYCRGPGFGYGECACINGVLPCYDPFSPGNQPDPGQECIIMDRPGKGGVTRRIHATKTSFTEDADGNPIDNAGGVNLALMPLHCWAPACNRSDRCMFRDIVGDQVPCPDVCAQYVDNVHINVKKIDSAKGVYIGNHVLQCSLGSRTLKHIFVPSFTTSEIFISPSTPAVNDTLTVTFVDFTGTSSSAPPQGLRQTSSAPYTPGTRAKPLTDVSPATGQFRAYSSLQPLVTVVNSGQLHTLTPSAPSANIQIVVDPSKIQLPRMSTFFIAEIILRDESSANPDVIVPLNIHLMLE